MNFATCYIYANQIMTILLVFVLLKLDGITALMPYVPLICVVVLRFFVQCVRLSYFVDVFHQNHL